tara:strand:+ start:268 stop:1992 length:1725 start_codon:yes stop_codon:yes gene_type:complete
MSIDKKQAANIFEEIARLLELKGANQFRTRAYVGAARTLRSLDMELEELVDGNEKVKGIGASSMEKLRELVKTGKMEYYESLKAEFPEGVLDLMKIPRLGPKKVKVLYQQLNITSLDDLEKACEQDELLSLDGFGAKTQENILKGIKHVRQYKGRHLVRAAHVPAQEFLSHLQTLPEVLELDLAGSLRRRKETVKDIDIVVSTEEPKAVMNAFVNHPLVHEIIAHGDTKSSVTLDSGINIDLRTVTPEQYAYALLHFTGSKEHNTVMRSRAKDKGLKLNEYGLFRGEERIHASSEEEIYGLLDLPFIPPELREDHAEFSLAEGDGIPSLVTLEDLKGTFHAHTTYSDGSASLDEMAQAAMLQGLEYLGITDHSQTAYYAGGLNVYDIEKQHKEIDALNESYDNFRIFKGIESDILADGSLDYPEPVLASFDFIIASVHSQFNLTKDEMTQRIIKAIENPYTTMLGHPTGRLLLSRESYPIDMHKVIDAAIANGVIVEINANPHRLDIDWRLLQYAKEKGMLTSINPDAHSTEGINDMIYGVGIARKGGLQVGDVLNTLSLQDVASYLDERHPGR